MKAILKDRKGFSREVSGQMGYDGHPRRCIEMAIMPPLSCRDYQVDMADVYYAPKIECRKFRLMDYCRYIDTAFYEEV